MLPCFVMLDLETTGGQASHDRITEIAAVRLENGVETVRWSTLVNPGCGIPPFIQSLTGISNAMVRDAPPFEQVAQKLLTLLDGAVLVAHNVRFDHSFLTHELARLGHTLRTPTLCTVRLSRKLYPLHKSHGLDALLARHGLHTSARHRAMGDVDAVLQWLGVASTELGEAAVHQAATALLQGSAALPPLLETDVSQIPDTPGVYLFYGESAIPLYVGKSIHLRTRVMSHFQAATKVAREMRILQEIRRIEWHETAGELGALLLESRLVKELQPLHNRQLRRERQLHAWQLAADPTEYPLLQLRSLADLEPDDLSGRDLGSLYGVYRSRRQALDTLQTLCDSHGLCPRALGLEPGKAVGKGTAKGTGNGAAGSMGRSACFAHQVGKCKGLCAGRESPALHHARLQMALAAQRLRTWPHPGPIALREHDRTTDRTDIHLFHHWCHLATVHDETALHEATQTRYPLAFDLDTYRLLLKHLAPGSKARVFHLPKVADWQGQES